MNISRLETTELLGRIAAQIAGEIIFEAIVEKEEAIIVLDAEANPFELFSNLSESRGIDWSKVSVFLSGESLGFSAAPPGTFWESLKERFPEQLGSVAVFHTIREKIPDPFVECERLNDLIANREIDLAYLGIGENGHLAFNDPPADFETEKPYISIPVDSLSRNPRYPEDRLSSLQEVPKFAITMSCRQILKVRKILCVVEGARKAKAVRDVVYGEITDEVPASILQQHSDCTLLLDYHSSALLERLA